MIRKKVNLGLTMSQETLKELDAARGQYSRSMVVEAMIMDTLGIADEKTVFGLRNWR